MRIAMLGHSGVGKTTYMSTLYGEMQSAARGLALRVNDANQHAELLNQSRQIRQGIYPAATAVRSEYEYMLTYGNKPPLDFTWADYSGGALSRGSDSDVDGQTARLREDVANVDGVMVFCDAAALAANRVRGSDVARLITLVSTAVEAAETPFALAIVLTKTDLVEGVELPMINRFKGLVDAINASRYVYGAFIPIACGTQLTNIDLPLCFALQSAVFKRGLLIEAAHEAYAAAAVYAQRKSQGVGGFLDKFVVSPLLKQQTWETIAQARGQMVSSLVQEYDQIVAALSGISGRLRDVPVVDSAKSMTVYVTEIKQALVLPQTITRQAGGQQARSLWDL